MEKPIKLRGETMYKVNIVSPNNYMTNNITEALLNKFHNLLDITGQYLDYRKPPNQLYLDELDKVISSHILICAFDVNSHENIAGITRATSLYTSSLETLSILGIRHSPKLLIGLPVNLGVTLYNPDWLFIIGAVHEWGTLAFSEEEMLDLIANYVDTNPLP